METHFTDALCVDSTLNLRAVRDWEKPLVHTPTYISINESIIEGFCLVKKSHEMHTAVGIVILRRELRDICNVHIIFRRKMQFHSLNTLQARRDIMLTESAVTLTCNTKVNRLTFV